MVRKGIREKLESGVITYHAETVREINSPKVEASDQDRRITTVQVFEHGRRVGGFVIHSAVQQRPPVHETIRELICEEVWK